MPMPATLLIDAGYLIILGAVFGLAAWRTERGTIGRRPLACALAALGIFGIGMPVFFYTRWPEWMWAYFVDPGAVPDWIVAMAFGLYVPVFLAAFFVAVETKRAGGWAVLVFGVLLQIVLIAATWERYRRTGHFEGYPGPDEGVMAVCTFGLVIGAGALWNLARKRD